jgi:hypothetical protein
MHIRFDEAGDFNYENPNRFWVSVVAGVVIPDSRWEAIERFVDECCAAWQVDELKAEQMNHSQLLEVARFIAREELTVAAIATDSRVFTAADQAAWREWQYEKFVEAADRSERAKNDPEIAERIARLRRRMAARRHIKPADYLQYGALMPWLIARLIMVSLVAYRALPPGDDSWVMDIVLDAKGAADPGKAGELLRDALEHILVGDDRTALWIPPEWPNDHPFFARNTDPERPVISARQVLAAGIHPGSSHEDAGLQLADFVAHVLLTLIREPTDEGALAAWRALAPRIAGTDDGWPFKVWAWAEGDLPPAELARYEAMADALMDTSADTA